MITTFGDDLDNDPTSVERVRALTGPGQRWAAFDGASDRGDRGHVRSRDRAAGRRPAPDGGADDGDGPPDAPPPRPPARADPRATWRTRGDRGYPISGLWASEASIYGRFGYGIAAEGDDVQIGNAHSLALAEPREYDATEYIDEARARRELPAIYDRATAGRPGALIRSEAWWRERRFIEAPFMREGASRLRHVLAVRAGRARRARRRSWWATSSTGSAPDFTNGLPHGSLEIIELMGVDLRARGDARGSSRCAPICSPA